MTKEQAERVIRDNFSEVWADGIIKALKQEPTEKKYSKTCGTCEYFRKHQNKEDIEICKKLFGENTVCGYCTYWEDTHEVALPTIEYHYCSHYEGVKNDTH